MTTGQINILLAQNDLPGDGRLTILLETHISWVLMGYPYVFKIKKPIQYSFLDYSTLEQRHYYCHRELILNRRLTKDVYLDVMPVCEDNGHYSIGRRDGKVIDYAVRMNRLDDDRRMDRLVKQGKVTAGDIRALAVLIGGFHRDAEVCYPGDPLDIGSRFRDIAGQVDFIREELGEVSANLAERAIDYSDGFLNEHGPLLPRRVSKGMFRDVHGDLHTRNIFLLPAPCPFDCIEFNDDFRRIDVLDEAAFLCMDLDALGRGDMAERWFAEYSKVFSIISDEGELLLFNYYKCYRANIRAKVNLLRARTATCSGEKSKFLPEAEKYLRLMGTYID